MVKKAVAKAVPSKAVTAPTKAPAAPAKPDPKILAIAKAKKDAAAAKLVKVEAAKKAIAAAKPIIKKTSVVIKG